MNPIERDLRALVAIPSVTGSEEQIQDHVARWFAEAGLRVVRMEPSLDTITSDPAFPGFEMERTTLPLVAGHLETGVPGPRLLLVAHVDVVPPGDLGSWSNDPFQPWLADGNLYGRGACDMKAGLVASVEAVRRASKRAKRLTGEIVVVAVPSEEDGGAGSLAAIRSGYTGDMCIIPEPTRLEVVIAHAGAITFTLDVPGKAAHASTRREGVSALDHLTYLINALEKDEEHRNRSETNPVMSEIGLPYPTIIGKVAGGSWASTVMDRVRADGRYGVRLGQDADGAADELRETVTAAWQAHPFLSRHPVGLELWGGRFDSSSIEADHELPRSLSRAIEKVRGSEPNLVGVPYGADMRLFIHEGDTPTVMFGPGDVRVAHSADEHVPLDEVDICAEALAVWLLDLCDSR